MNKREILIAIICLSLIPVGFVFWVDNVKARETVIKEYTMQEYSMEIKDLHYELDNKEVESDEINIKPNGTTSININFAGDCTLGSDSNFGYKNTFYDVYDHLSGDYGYFFKNMQSLFANDDLTVVNLEGTFTDYKVKTPKKFNFRASPEYAKILLSGDIDAVNLANNHMQDYGNTGYNDTMQTLKDYNVPFFGYDNYYIYEKDGIKIGFVGLTTIWDGTIEKRIDDAMAYFNENNCNSVIVTFHWGIERAYQQNSTQRKVGRYAIDHGADLVVGHHSHVIQGIEEYNGKYIVYSLANFCFGGNTNPPDKDTFVFNIKLEFESGDLINNEARIYPARVSSVNNKNDFKPTLAEGDEFIRILNKVLRYGNVKADENGIILKN